MTDWHKLGPFVKGFAGAVIGVVLVLAIWHVYTDHVAFHQIVNAINANAAQQQRAAPLPAPTPTP